MVVAYSLKMKLQSTFPNSSNIRDGASYHRDAPLIILPHPSKLLNCKLFFNPHVIKREKFPFLPLIVLSYSFVKYKLLHQLIYLKSLSIQQGNIISLEKYWYVRCTSFIIANILNDHLAKTSMAATNDVTLCYAAKAGWFNASWPSIKPKRCRSFSVIASASNQGNLEMISGKKVNGIRHVHEAPNVRTKINSHDDELVVKQSQQPDNSPLRACLLGRFVEDRFVYRQTFSIRSYEIGPDKTATMETLMNLLQVGIFLFY